MQSLFHFQFPGSVLRLNFKPWVFFLAGLSILNLFTCLWQYLWVYKVLFAFSLFTHHISVVPTPSFLPNSKFLSHFFRNNLCKTVLTHQSFPFHQFPLFVDLVSCERDLVSLRVKTSSNLSFSLNPKLSLATFLPQKRR